MSERQERTESGAEVARHVRSLEVPQGEDRESAGEKSGPTATRAPAEPASPTDAGPSGAKHAKPGDTLLYLDGVTKSFDGFKAIDNLSLVLGRGEMRAIIGPNGAGKTTMMDIITGKTRPDSGEVYFAGTVDLTRHDEAAIAGLGIGRKFQKPTVFENHTVEDNLRMALSGSRSMFAALFHRPDSAENERLDRLLATTRLTDRRDDIAAALSHGQKQWLEIGMLMAQDPQLLLVDEPVAGMTDAETEETARLLREIAGDHTVVVVEHDMQFVRDLDVKVTCLNEGTVLSEGSIDQVSADPRVVEVYLGR